MKNIRASLSIGLTVASVLVLQSLQAQGTFRNLDFELANVPALPAGQYGSLNGVLASDAIPFWSAYYGSERVSMVSHNTYTIGSANISILGPNWNNSFGTSIIDGSYTVVLQAGDTKHVSVSIAQSGTIPIDSGSIRVKVKEFEAAYSGLGVTLGGQNLPVVLLESDPGYSLFGVDISSFAGQTTELRLSAPSTTGSPFNSFEIDDIVFSNQPIPEPETLVLILAGGALMLVVIRGRRGRCESNGDLTN